MKRLDQLTREDLLEEHDLMMGVGHEEHGLFLLDTMTAEELMIAMEEHDELSRLEGLETEEGSEREASPSRQQINWQDHVIGPIVGRVRRPTGPDQSKPGKDQPPHA